ncbi:hypothetical protein BDB01DRAFT_426483 [Pilobolus umbonatus]|nr:hypothetical protein BDB01DRAFT_426483 [Pilobolus umbonatus]
MDTADTRLILEEIDLARCRAQWSVLPELLKKYRRIVPDHAVYEITVSSEVELMQLLSENKKYSSDLEMKGWDRIHQHDQPHHIELLPIIDPALVEPLVDRLKGYFNEEVKEEDMTQVDWQLQFTKIILARVYFESGQYEEALQLLQNLALKMEDVQTGYGLVMLIQARAMKGICLEKQGNDEAAIEAYEAAWNSVEAQPQERGVMLSFWIEECIYRGSLLNLKLNLPTQNTLKFMRAYIQLVSSHWSPQWRMYRRWVISKHYANYLIQVYKDGNHDLSCIGMPMDMTINEEMANLLNLYRTLYTMISPHLTPKEQNSYALELTSIIFKAHDTIGWGEIIHIKRILQFLYMIKSNTFNHPTINRCMFFTLMRLGSLEEAKFSLSSYLDLIGLPDFTEAAVINERRDHSHDSAHISHKLMSYPEETISEVILALLVGIQLFGAEEENGKMAVALSELVLALIDLTDNEISPKEKVSVYRAVGASYSLLASQCEESNERSGFHEKSLHYFQLAVSMCDTCWKSHYTLGLQQAIMRDVNGAMISVTKSIELNPQHIYSWHLLALLHSCKQTDTAEKALQALEAAIQLIYPSQQAIIDSSMMGIHAFSWGGEKNANDVFNRAHAYLSTRMTQLGLREGLHGSEHIMNQYQELFSVYTHLSQQLGLSQLALVSEDPSPIGEKDPPSRKSSFSMIRRTSISSITSSLGGRRRRASLQESEKGSANGNKKSESDNEQGSVHSSGSNRSSSLRKKNKRSLPTRTMSSTINNTTLSEAELKRRNLQLISLGLAQRIGSPSSGSVQNRSPSSPTSPTSPTPQAGSSPLKRELTSAVSLASLLTPSYSMGSLRSNSVSSRSFSVLNVGKKVATNRDGLLVSTFNQHHQAFEIRKKAQWQSLLVTLWLMSVKTFIQAGLLDEANKALSEAEQLGLGDPDVWYQLAQLSLKAREGIQDKEIVKELEQVASDSYNKALVLDPDHIPSQIGKAKRWMELKEWDLAEGILEEVTYGLGWDSSEAWYQMSKIKEHEGELDRAKTCLLYALELSESQPLRQLSILPIFV